VPLRRVLTLVMVLASFVLGGLVFAGPLKPNRSHSAVPHFVFRSYRQTEGLRNLTVTALSRDTGGFLWVGTQNGLFRFLGSAFQAFGGAEGIPEATIEDVVAAPDGSVWVGTLKNLYRWTGKRFVPATPDPVHTWRSGRMLYEGPGSLLVADGNRLSRLAYRPDGSAISFLPVFADDFENRNPGLKNIGSLAQDHTTLWFGCSGQLCSSSRSSLTKWGKAQGVPDEFCYSLRFDANSSLWAVLEHHVLELPPGASSFLDRTPPGGDPGSVYHRQPLLLDPQGRVVVSAGRSLQRWDGSQWLTIGPASGMAFGHLNALSFDTSGDLWMGSMGKGLHNWTGYSNWESWTERQGLPSGDIWSPGVFSSDSIYIGTEQGPAEIDNTTGAVIPLFRSPDWTYGQVSGLVVDPQRILWVGTKSGALLRIDPRTRNVSPAATLPANVLGILDQPEGRMLVLTKKGMFGLVRSAHSGAVSTESIEAANALAGTSQRMSNACASPDGALWFATRGVLQLRNGVWSSPAITGLATETKVWNGIACSPDGTLWLMGRAGEVWRVSTSNGTLQAAILPFPDQYRSLSLVAILADSRGWLWLGTDTGLLVWNGVSWRHLTQENGLIWNDVNTGGLAASPDGSIWIGTSGGLGHISHPESLFAGTSLPISLIDIRRGTQSVSTENLTSLSGSPDMTFEFAVPSILSRSDLTFNYRIAELDSDWMETRNTNAHFAALPSGSYTFEVFARNLALDTRSPIAIAHFRILPPWWRTYWFLGFCGLGTVGLLFALYHLRTRRLISQQRVLETLVQNRTLELEISRAELLSQATHDGLTGLMNRCAILDSFSVEIARAQRENSPLTVVLADVDHFKRVNDTYGHMAGDAALRRFAEALVGSTRTYDFAGRYGGEEFLILLPGVSSAEASSRLASLHQGISDLRVNDRNGVFSITCSFGSVSLDSGQSNFEHDRILAAADQALYRAKAEGRNRVVHHAFDCQPAIIQVR
jgi:diguanylate cyclase (GGDEF)-like protein